MWKNSETVFLPHSWTSSNEQSDGDEDRSMTTQDERRHQRNVCRSTYLFNSSTAPLDIFSVNNVPISRFKVVGIFFWNAEENFNLKMKSFSSQKKNTKFQ